MDQPPPLPPISATVAPTTATIQQNFSDSVESSPRSRIAETWNEESLPPVPGAKLRLMCSYGGHIMPRPHDKSLCYVGGDTRIVVVDRHSSLKDLCSRLSRTLLNGRPFTLKYQLPNEDLDNLITVTNDEDLDNMIEEFDRVTAASASHLKPSSSRLRVFLFFTKPESSVSMGSLLDDSKSETWFVDALNNSGILSRGVSDSAAGDCFVNLDSVGGSGGVSVPASGSSNNLEAQADNNKSKNTQDVMHSMPGSPMLENSSPHGSSTSPSMANLPPIRVRVDETGASRLQQEQRIGVMEEQFAQMSFASNGVMKQDEGCNIASSAVAMPNTVPASTVTMVPVSSSDNIMNRVVSDDERSDHGVPVGLRKPPLPLQLVQPKTSAGYTGGGAGGLSLPSPDSVASDSSSIASTNSFSKTVYYQEQVQAAQADNKAATLPNARNEMSDHNTGLQREQFQDSSSYMLPPQLDPNQQFQQQQFVHASTHYIHHPTATGPMPVPSYYPIYATPSSQQQLPHPIGQQQYPFYVMPVGHTQQPYNMALQQNITDPNVGGVSSRPLMSQNVASSTTYKDGTPPIYPNKSSSPNPAFYQIPTTSQFQQQYVGVPQVHHHHNPPQSIVVAPPSGGGTNYGYEYGGHVQDQGYYTTQQQNTAPILPPQYQSMTPAAAAAALSDASKQFPADNVQQPNRTSQPV